MDLTHILLNLVVFSMPIISIIYILLGQKLFVKQANKKYPASSFLMFAISIFLFGFFLELNSLTDQAFQLTRLIKYLGLTFIPCFGILFIGQLTGKSPSSKKHFFYSSSRACFGSYLSPTPYTTGFITASVLNGLKVFPSATASEPQAITY